MERVNVELTCQSAILQPTAFLDPNNSWFSLVINQLISSMVVGINQLISQIVDGTELVDNQLISQMFVGQKSADNQLALVVVQF